MEREQELEFCGELLLEEPAVHTKFGENRNPFCPFFKESKADFFYKKHKKLKNWYWNEYCAGTEKEQELEFCGELL